MNKKYIILIISLIISLIFFTILFNNNIYIGWILDIKWDINVLNSNTNTWFIDIKKLSLVKRIGNKVIHINTPNNVKVLYYSANAINNKTKFNNFLKIADKKEINSIMIDLKEVDWYTSFKLNNKYFTNIYPVSNNRIKNIKEIIDILHKKWIYIIARIAVFKDKRLAEKRPDLAVKWLKDNTTWYDYKWNKYVDPYSKEVWNYNKELWIAAYEMWFDEINYDYIRFPTDWKISATYYTFWNNILSKNTKWGKVKIIDKFSNYITNSLKKYNKNIIVSADVFWLVTDFTMFWIWQNLESFLLNFDFVWPMIYPSHYWYWHYWYKYPDNVPYNIINIALNNAKNKINDLNIKINNVKSWTWILKYNNLFIYSNVDLKNKDVDIKQIRPYLQWFSCTRCSNYTLYNRNKFRSAVKWVNDVWINSWWVRSSWWNYRFDRFNKIK